ncbi:MAG: inorganic triphosphatase YgiF [Candidatus Paceibacteria bacterium]|jgi:inorganic triphosphatase YgiF
MHDGAHMEIEARLALVGEQDRELFAQIRASEEVAGLRHGSFVVLDLSDMYFDGALAPLAAMDCALRLRRQTRAGEERLQLAFKGPAQSGDSHCVARFELEAAWSTDFLGEVLAELRERGLNLGEQPASGSALECLRKLGLTPVQERNTRREAATLFNASGDVAELTLDQVSYSLPEQRVLHREIEIEAREGTTAAEILALAQVLEADAEGELLPWRWSKTALGRALEEVQAEGVLSSLVEGERLTRSGYQHLAEHLKRPR